MGNLFAKKNKHINIDNSRLLDFTDVNMYDDNDNIPNGSISNDLTGIIKYIELLRAELSQAKQTEKGLIDKLSSLEKEYSKQIYKQNEEINSIKTDLKMLLDNDKKLADSIHKHYDSQNSLTDISNYNSVIKETEFISNSH